MLRSVVVAAALAAMRRRIEECVDADRRGDRRALDAAIGETISVMILVTQVLGRHDDERELRRVAVLWQRGWTAECVSVVAEINSRIMLELSFPEEK